MEIMAKTAHENYAIITLGSMLCLGGGDEMLKDYYQHSTTAVLTNRTTTDNQTPPQQNGTMYMMVAPKNLGVIHPDGNL